MGLQRHEVAGCCLGGDERRIGAVSRVGVLAGWADFEGERWPAGGRKATARAGRAVAGNLELGDPPPLRFYPACCLLKFSNLHKLSNHYRWHAFE